MILKKKRTKKKKSRVYSKEQFSIGVLERVAEALMQCLRGYKIDLTVSEDKNNKKKKKWQSNMEDHILLTLQLCSSDSYYTVTLPFCGT